MFFVWGSGNRTYVSVDMPEDYVMMADRPKEEYYGEEED